MCAATIFVAVRARKGNARQVVGTTPGTIDYRDERFVARFPYDASLVAELKTLRQGPRQKASDEWIIERHRPSVARLVRIARDRSWHFTTEARKALRQLQDQAEAAVFSLDVVQGNAGEPWFLCMCGDDYDLQQRVKSLPGAFLDDADDSWWVPADSQAACADLLEIAENDDRMEVSDAAWRLLEEPDASFALPRSATSPELVPQAGGDAIDDAGLPAGTWDPTELDYQMHALSSAIREDDFKVSPALRGTLLPYQIAGVRYLCSASRAVLADEHGLGKTVQALATIETLGAYPALVVCPAPLQLSWLREAQRWLPAEKTLAVLNASSESVPMVDVLIVGYEALAGHRQLLEERGFEAIVADESHYLKSRETPRAQAAIAIAASVPMLRLCLSSRPYGTQPVDLAGQLAFLGVLDAEFGGFWPFASRYCAPKDDGGSMRFGAARTDELAQRLRSTCYCRREKLAVRAQLPDHVRAVHWLELDDRAAYAAVEQEAREALRSLTSRDDALPDATASEARRATQLELVERVLHACGRQKTAGIARWVANFLSTGEPLVVFAQHRDVLTALRESFPRALAIAASDTPLQRDKAVRAFQSGESPLIICAQHAEASVAPLTRARHVAFAELAWSAAPRDQALARIHRIGAERSAMAWYLVGDGTIDEQVLEVVSRRRVAAGELHESVLLEVADEIARMTAPRPSMPESAPITKLTKIVG